MDCSPPGSAVHGVLQGRLLEGVAIVFYRLLCPWTSPGKNTGVSCHSLLQGIFLTQGSNPGPLHCRQILYQLKYEGSSLCYTTAFKSEFASTEISTSIPLYSIFLCHLFLNVFPLNKSGMETVHKNHALQLAGFSTVTITSRS